MRILAMFCNSRRSDNKTCYVINMGELGSHRQCNPFFAWHHVPWRVRTFAGLSSYSARENLHIRKLVVVLYPVLGPCSTDFVVQLEILEQLPVTFLRIVSVFLAFVVTIVIVVTGAPSNFSLSPSILVQQDSFVGIILL